MWAAQAARMGYRWCVGDAKKVRFWKDHWFGSCYLAIQYWDVYTIVNEQGCALAEAWDGCNLRFTFRRTVNRRVMNQWLELLQIASDISFNEELSFGSLTLVGDIHTSSLEVAGSPEDFHIFLWLLTKNKILTRDNLAKREIR
jgi:hypothetical protein